MESTSALLNMESTSALLNMESTSALLNMEIKGTSALSKRGDYGATMENEK
jgi:hypothetical protein